MALQTFIDEPEHIGHIRTQIEPEYLPRVAKGEMFLSHGPWPFGARRWW